MTDAARLTEQSVTAFYETTTTPDARLTEQSVTAFYEAPVPPDARLTEQSATAFYETPVAPDARLTEQSATAFYETPVAPDARLSEQYVIVWYSPSDEVTETASATDSVSSAVGTSHLYWDSTGQLVISASLPAGGSAVPGPPSYNLSDAAPWLRGLDTNDGSSTWHPANYYNSGQEQTTPLNTDAGGNIMPNADLNFGVDYWAVFYNQGGGTNYAGPTWDLYANAPAGGHSVGMARAGTAQAASGNFDIIYTKPITVSASTPYEISAYVAAFNCAVSIYVNFYKLVADVETLISASEIFGASQAEGGQDIINWDRVGGVTTTPADCQYLKFCIRGGAAIGSNPLYWATHLFVGQAYEGKTELSPWGPGGNSGAFGELESLTSSHDAYTALITVTKNVLFDIISNTFTSVISPSRARKLLVTFSTETPTTNTNKLYVYYESGTFSDTKIVYDSASAMSQRFITFTSILSIPAGYDADITVTIQIRQNDDVNNNAAEVRLSVIELPT
jgi:hypothetical protein